MLLKLKYIRNLKKTNGPKELCSFHYSEPLTTSLILIFFLQFNKEKSEHIALSQTTTVLPVDQSKLLVCNCNGSKETSSRINVIGTVDMEPCPRFANALKPSILC